jgi:hypothetical protein
LTRYNAVWYNIDNKRKGETKMILNYVFDDRDYEYETDGRAFLKTLTREQLLWGLDEPEELAEKTNAELIELLAQEDLQEIYGYDIEDFYYAEAEQEYAEMLQAIADEKWERDRGRL